MRRLAQRLRLAVDQAEALATQIGARVQPACVALTRRCGVSLLTAGALAGILGPAAASPPTRSSPPTPGCAPLEASSAGRGATASTAAGTGASTPSSIGSPSPRPAPPAGEGLPGPPRAAEGKRRREALRALKRHLVRAIWRLWQECLPGSRPPPPPAGCPRPA